MLGKTEDGRRRGRQRIRWLDGVTDTKDMSLGKALGVADGQGGPGLLRSMGSQSWTRLRD